MSERRFQAVVIGASAGAVEALSAVLAPLPADFALPIMIVVHIPSDKQSMLPELFRMKSKLQVTEAEDKQRIQAGTVYFAPPDYHLLVEENKTLSLSNEEPELFSRPSIDVLFETAADAYGEHLIGIILTGANHDGAKGLKAIADAGGEAVVQQPEGAYAAAMPQAALKVCPKAQVMKLEAIAGYLQKVSSL